MNEGDWVEGEVKWWWKFVFPQKAKFWGQILQNMTVSLNPQPDPWLQATTADVLETVVMLHAATKATDREQRASLYKEAAQKLEGTVAAIAKRQ
jgi:hypothetical protein